MSDITKRALEASLKKMLLKNRLPKLQLVILQKTAVSTVQLFIIISKIFMTSLNGPVRRIPA